MVYVLIIIFILLAVLEIPGLIHKKLWGELAAVLVFLTIGFTLSLPLVLGIKVPSPNNGIKYVITTIAQKIGR
ncbi:MAG: hypothetical protein H0Z38_09265 [Firmicutes bacterium]|nr:hypothetical protein [Bacillota bacterium]